MQILAVRHLDPDTRQPIGDTFHTLHPFCDHGVGLRFLLEGFDGWPLAVGVFDPNVNAAAQLAAQER